MPLIPNRGLLFRQQQKLVTLGFWYSLPQTIKGWPPWGRTSPERLVKPCETLTTKAGDGLIPRMFSRVEPDILRSRHSAARFIFYSK